MVIESFFNNCQLFFCLFRERVFKVFGYYFSPVAGKIKNKNEEEIGKEIQYLQGKECYQPVKTKKDIISDDTCHKG